MLRRLKVVRFARESKKLFGVRQVSTLRRLAQAGLTEEQKEFHQLALDFMESEVKPKAKEWDASKMCDRRVIEQAAELFGGLYIPEDHGGTGLSRHDTTLVFEALSQGCIATTALITIHNMTAWMLSSFGSDDLRMRYLPSMLTSQLLGSYCLTESHCGGDASALRTSAIRDGKGNFKVNGSKMFVSGGGLSDLYFVMCRTSEDRTKGISCLLIPSDTPGVHWNEQPELKMGWHASPTRQIFFEDVIIPETHLIGSEGQGFKIALSALDGGRLNIAACSLGAAQRCLEDTLNYTAQRHAFGQPILDFQNTSFTLADLTGRLQKNRLLLRSAAQSFDVDYGMSEDKTLLCAMAKQQITDDCFDICNACLQLFGGYGYLHDYEIERFVRDCRVHQILEGTNEIMKLVVSRALRTDVIDPS